MYTYTQQQQLEEHSILAASHAQSLVRGVDSRNNINTVT